MRQLSWLARHQWCHFRNLAWEFMWSTIAFTFGTWRGWPPMNSHSWWRYIWSIHCSKPHRRDLCGKRNSCVQWEVITTSTKCDCIICYYCTLLQETIERLAKILQPLTWFHLIWTHQPSRVPANVNPGVHTLTFCWTTGPNNQAVRRFVAQWWLSHDDVSGIINHHLRLQLFILRKSDAPWRTCCWV